MALLTLVLIIRLGHSLSPATVRGALQRLGLRWRRPRLRMPPTTDPHKAAKPWAMAEAVRAAGPDTAMR